MISNSQLTIFVETIFQDHNLAAPLSHDFFIIPFCIRTWRMPRSKRKEVIVIRYLSNEKRVPACSDVGGYSTQSYRDYTKPM